MSARWWRGAILCAVAATLGGACSTDPADGDARAVRTSVVAWFRAVRLADAAAVAAAMSSTCPAGSAQLFIDSYRVAASAGLQDASVGAVTVLDVQGDLAHAELTLDLQGTFGTGASAPGTFDVVREQGRWVVSC